MVWSAGGVTRSAGRRRAVYEPRSEWGTRNYSGPPRTPRPLTDVTLISSALPVIQYREDRVPIAALILFAVLGPPFVVGFLGMVGWLDEPDPTGSAWRWRPTGAPGPPPVAAPGCRWRGGINAPHWHGWFHSPLAYLDIDSSHLVIRVLLGWLFLLRPLKSTPGDEPNRFPVRTRLGRRGVAIQPRGGQPWYIWKPASSELLSNLAWARFNVAWEERRPRFF